MSRIAPDQILTEDLTDNLISDISNGLDSLNPNTVEPRSLRSDHLDPELGKVWARGNHARLGLTQVFNRDTDWNFMFYGSDAVSSSPKGGPKLLTTPYALIECSLTLEIIEGTLHQDVLGSVFDTFNIRPVALTLVGSTPIEVVPWGGRGTMAALSRHDAGGPWPSRGPSDIALDAVSEELRINNRVMTFHSSFLLPNAGPSRTLTAISWQIRCETASVTFGQWTTSFIGSQL